LKKLAGVLLRFAGAEDGRSRDQHIRSCFDDLTDRIVSNAAVDLNTKVEPHLFAQLDEVGDLIERERKELLAAEPGVDAHDENVVQHGKDFDQRTDRRGRVDDDAGQHAVMDDLLQGAMEMLADLLMNAHQVGSRFGEVLDERVRIFDHHVAVERQLGHGPKRLDHRRSEGDVGDEVAVHDIDVEDGGSAAFGRGDLVGEMREVRGEDGSCQFDHGLFTSACKFISVLWTSRVVSLAFPRRAPASGPLGQQVLHFSRGSLLLRAKLMWRLLLLALSPVVLLAQTSVDRWPAPTPATAPTIQVTSRIVYVDVVVRDGRGQIVRGLTQNDFRVTEDGAPQEVDLFRAYTHDVASAAGGPGKDASPAKLEFSNSAAGRSDTVNMIVFDLLNTSMTNQTYARKQMLKFLGALPPGHKIALFILSDRLHMLQSFTGNSELLAQAAGLLMPKASFLFKSGSDQMRDADILGMSSADMKSGGASSFAMDLADELSKEGFQHDQERNGVTNQAFRELAQASAAYTGRKNLIWLSESFPLGAITSLQSFHSSLGTSFYMADLSGPTAKTISDSRIAVYPISVAGLESGGVNAAMNGVTAAAGNGAALGGGVAIPSNVGSIDSETSGGVAAAQPGGQTGGARLSDTLGAQGSDRLALRDELDDIAQQTGGQAFVGTNDLAGAMRKSLEAGENYYSLAYSPSNENWNGKFRRIRVELAHKGYSLSYRRGYVALPGAPAAPGRTPSQDHARDLLVALQPATPELDMIPVRSKVYLPDKQRATLQVDALLGSKAIRFALGADGRRSAQLLLGLVAIPEAMKGEVAGQASEALKFNLSDAQYQLSVAMGLPVRLQMPLKPGRYLLRLGVSDMNSHRIGTLDMPVEIPPGS
jgi:VWFA-related protein